MFTSSNIWYWFFKERVRHLETGFIAKNDQEFADYTVKLLSDDEFFLNIKKKMYSKRHENNWVSIANEMG